MAVVCDAATVKGHPFLKGLLEHIEAHNMEWRSALEYLPEGGGGYLPEGGGGGYSNGALAADDKAAIEKKGLEAKKKVSYWSHRGYILSIWYPIGHIKGIFSASGIL